MRAFLRAAVIAGLCLFAVIGGGAATACGDDNDSTGPAGLTCDDVSFNASIGGGPPQIIVPIVCSSGQQIVTTTTGITYDQFSRVTAYSYSIECEGGSPRHVATVSSIQYNNLGQPTSLQFRFNGTQCGQVTFSL